MKEKIVLLTFFFLGAVACHDHSIENAFWEKEAGGSPIEEFLKIDDTRYGEFCADERFVEICSVYNEMSHLSNSSRLKRTEVLKSIKLYGENKQCDNLLAYIIKYVDENHRMPSSRIIHDWGVCELYPYADYVCNVRNNWDMAWRDYYSDLIAMVGFYDSPELRAYVKSTIEVLENKYYGYQFGHNYRYDDVCRLIISSGMDMGKRYSEFSILEIQDIINIWAHVPVKNTCTYVYCLREALYDASNIASNLYTSYIPEMSENFPPTDFDPILGGNTVSGNGYFEGEVRVEWWESGHNSILKKVVDKLNLSEIWLEYMAAGSAAVDEVQDVEFAYKHAMREENQTEEEAIELMRVFFVEESYSFIVQEDLFSLGEALHPIMDIYSPAHALKVWKNNVWYYFPHLFENCVFHGDKMDLAALAVEEIFVKVVDINPNLTEEEIRTRLTEIFYQWLLGENGPLGPPY
ncbi:MULTISPECIES: hypothetical protein [Butyricimonas]|uniref:hypothetical protein n=1 Tax=Butyricimonas TaxID=574697 RepID=UPI0007FB4638|nr:MULTISPECIES: hypothetical protein [Butyricimonas]